MSKYVLTALLTLAAVTGSGGPVLSQDAGRRLDLRFEADGTVTLVALNVSLQEILAEWARQCGCHVVNATGLSGRIDVPLQFERRPQQEVLRSLLRPASGYALTPRREGMAGPSAFETIYVVPSSRASQAAYTPPPPVPAPSIPAPTVGSPIDEIPPVTPMPTLGQPDTLPQSPEVPAPANQAPVPRLPGTPSRFVPIVPVTPANPGATPEQPPSRPPGPVPAPGATP